MGNCCKENKPVYSLDVETLGLEDSELHVTQIALEYYDPTDGSIKNLFNEHYLPDNNAFKTI